MACDEYPRRFYLYRREDPSDISGRGVVAQGVEFHDGYVVLRWRGPNASTVVWDSIVKAMRVHGHGGLTTAVYLDECCDCAEWSDDAPGRAA